MLFSPASLSNSRDGLHPVGGWKESDFTTGRKDEREKTRKSLQRISKPVDFRVATDGRFRNKMAIMKLAS